MYRGIVATAVAAAGLGLLPLPALANEEGPSISFVKTVYNGHDGGAGCASAANFAEAHQGSPVTYCFTVTNTGSTHLASLVVTDALVAGTPNLLSAESTPLAPGHSARYFVEATPPADDADGAVDETFLNTASASALPVDAAGMPLAGVDQVMATAEAVVYPPEVVPVAGLALATSVYAGVDGGVGCPAAETTTVGEGDPVTWCLAVTNTGNTHLDTVAFSELGVEGTPVLLSGGLPLAPGATAMYHLDAVAPVLPPEGLTAHAVAQANAVDEYGADLTGLDDARASDGAVIQAQPPVPVAAAAPAPAPAAPAPAQGPTRPQVAAPQQLAYTGWEAWILAIGGVGVAAVGWLLVTSSGPSSRRSPVPVPVRSGAVSSGDARSGNAWSGDAWTTAAAVRAHRAAVAADDEHRLRPPQTMLDGSS